MVKMSDVRVAGGPLYGFRKEISAKSEIKHQARDAAQAPDSDSNIAVTGIKGDQDLLRLIWSPTREGNARGNYIQTLDLTDVCTGWT